MPVPALGIDFGTSHTVAVLRYDDGSFAPLLFDGSPLLPSAVFAEGAGELLVGRDALHSARMDPASFEPNPKRRIDDGAVLLGGREIAVPELFAAVFSRVREECVRVTGGVPDRLVATHPAEWGPTRRLTLEDAAQLAGFPRPQLLPEPVAAANYFARTLHRDVPRGSSVVVYDFGGGTFDASVVTAGHGGFEVRAVEGLHDLGGVDLDEAIVSHLGERFADDPEWTLLLRPQNKEHRRQRRVFYDDVRMAKERLSRYSNADVAVPLVGLDIHLTREELESLIRPLLQRAITVTEAVIRASRVPHEQIAGVFLVGGSSRMPLVGTMLHRATRIPPVVIEQPELVVAQGATVAEDRPSVAQAVPAASATGYQPQPAAREPEPAQYTPPGGQQTAMSPPAASASAKPHYPATAKPPGSLRLARWLMLLQTLCGLALVAIPSTEIAADLEDDFYFLPHQLIALALPAVLAAGCAAGIRVRQGWVRRLAIVSQVMQPVGVLLSSLLLMVALRHVVVQEDMTIVRNITGILLVGTAIVGFGIVVSPVGRAWWSADPAPISRPGDRNKLMIALACVLAIVAASVIGRAVMRPQSPQWAFSSTALAAFAGDWLGSVDGCDNGGWDDHSEGGRFTFSGKPVESVQCDMDGTRVDFVQFASETGRSDYFRSLPDIDGAAEQAAISPGFVVYYKDGAHNLWSNDPDGSAPISIRLSGNFEKIIEQWDSRYG